MSKELEALKISVDLGTEKDEQCVVINLHYKGVDHIIYETHDKEQVEALNKIKQQEAIDNSNPSEALELFEEFKHILLNNVIFLDTDLQRLNSIKQALLKAQEQEKVLEIIKEKDVNFEVFGAFETYKDYEIYYEKKFHLFENKLTQEEFDLLKMYCNKIKDKCE